MIDDDVRLAAEIAQASPVITAVVLFIIVIVLLHRAGIIDFKVRDHGEDELHKEMRDMRAAIAENKTEIAAIKAYNEGRNSRGD